MLKNKEYSNQAILYKYYTSDISHSFNYYIPGLAAGLTIQPVDFPPT